MRKKQMIRIIVDFMMTVLLLLLMTYNMIGDAFHEWAGVGMLFLFIFHHILNIRWIKTVIKGRYSAFRILQTLLIILIFVTMLGSMISGIILSRHVFVFLGIESGRSLARTIHLLCGYWNLILLSLHLGFHWNAMIGKAGQFFLGKSRVRVWILRILGIFIGIYGIYAFADRGIGSYLFLQNQFAFFNYEEPILMLLADYAAIMGTFVLIGHYTVKILKAVGSKKKESL